MNRFAFKHNLESDFAGRSVINKFRPHIIAITLTVLLFVASYFFTSAFNRYAENECNLENLDRQIRLLEKNKKELVHQRRSLAHIRKFIDLAGELGLERHKWETYDVTIEEKVDFPEAMRILTQTANSKSCYFHPISLHIKKLAETDPMTSGKANPEKEQLHKDLLLSLKGTFLVRQR